MVVTANGHIMDESPSDAQLIITNEQKAYDATTVMNKDRTDLNTQAGSLLFRGQKVGTKHAEKYHIVRMFVFLFVCAYVCKLCTYIRVVCV